MTNNINEKELENVTGGWQYANGSFVNYGNYIVYTVAPEMSSAASASASV